MASTKMAVDVQKKIPIDRSSSFGKSSYVIVPKKALNIPVGDVQIEDDYNSSIKPNFNLSSTFQRHTKKIGDEPDVVVDYCVEDDDLVWWNNNPKLSPDLIGSALTIDVFEIIINFFEKSTGFTNDLIPQAHAERILMDKFKWSPSIANKIISELHSYWMKKREKLNKPLLRKYWLTTPASDTNPHHCFRPRDKERYRLRKQQKKNDVEAYRKMQQLRREFGRARELLQLVVERETLREAEIDVKQELFRTEILITADDEENMLGIQNVSEEDLARFKYKLKYPHLIDDSFTSVAFRAAVNRSSSAGDKSQTHGRSERLLEGHYSTNLSSEELEAISARKRERKFKRKLAVADLASSSSVVGDTVTTAQAASAIPVVPLDPRMPGPPYYCRSVWPSFLDMPNYVDTKCDYFEYIKSLELPVEMPSFLGGISGVNQVTRVMVQREPEAALQSQAAVHDESAVIKNFVCRGRVGRGGRLVIDRFPIQDKRTKVIYSTDVPHKTTNFSPLDHSPSTLDYRKSITGLPQYLPQARAIRNQLIFKDPGGSFCSVDPGESDNESVSYEYPFFLKKTGTNSQPAMDTNEKRYKFEL